MIKLTEQLLKTTLTFERTTNQSTDTPLFRFNTRLLALSSVMMYAMAYGIDGLNYTPMKTFKYIFYCFKAYSVLSSISPDV